MHASAAATQSSHADSMARSDAIKSEYVIVVSTEAATDTAQPNLSTAPAGAHTTATATVAATTTIAAFTTAISPTGIARATATGNRHKCPHCLQAFTKLSALVRHERVHTGEQPYVCYIVVGRELIEAGSDSENHSRSNSRSNSCSSSHSSNSNGNSSRNNSSYETAIGGSPESTQRATIGIHTVLNYGGNVLNSSNSNDSLYRDKLCLSRFSERGNLKRHQRTHRDRPEQILAKIAANNSSNLHRGNSVSSPIGGAHLLAGSNSNNQQMQQMQQMLQQQQHIQRQYSSNTLPRVQQREQIELQFQRSQSSPIPHGEAAAVGLHNHIYIPPHQYTYHQLQQQSQLQAQQLSSQFLSKQHSHILALQSPQQQQQLLQQRPPFLQSNTIQQSYSSEQQHLFSLHPLQQQQYLINQQQQPLQKHEPHQQQLMNHNQQPQQLQQQLLHPQLWFQPSIPPLQQQQQSLMQPLMTLPIQQMLPLPQQQQQYIQHLSTAHQPQILDLQLQIQLLRQQQQRHHSQWLLQQQQQQPLQQHRPVYVALPQILMPQQHDLLQHSLSAHSQLKEEMLHPQLHSLAKVL